MLGDTESFLKSKLIVEIYAINLVNLSINDKMVKNKKRELDRTQKIWEKRRSLGLFPI